MGFEKAYNKYVKHNNAFNKKLNSIIGKDVFKEVKEIEPPREYQPYESFPPYTEPEPAEWTPLNGEAKEFILQGHILSVSENFDTCMQYRGLFKECARYYADRFKFKYQLCISDFDSLIHYFSDMYLEGLKPMLQRAYSLLLPFGIFSEDINSFSNKHTDTFNIAIQSYGAMTNIEASKNQQAENTGNMVGNSMHLIGGGFGTKGAMKGIAKAELFNMGMRGLGKLVEYQSRMSQEEKAEVYATFNQDVFFEEVYSDYYNTFLTLIQTLSDNGNFESVKTIKTNEFNTMIQNLQNPMFPQDKLPETLVNLITSYPFMPECYQLLTEKFGQTDEVNQITNYFIG